MVGVRSNLFAVLLLGVLGIPVCAEVQQSASLSQSESAKARSSAKISKTELAGRFQDIKVRYATIKTTAEKYAPLKPDAPSEVKVLRLKIDAAMRSYDYNEFQTQRQRDQLNRLVLLSEMDSVKLQMAMDRLSKMSGTISRLMKTLNDTGDAVLAAR